MYHCWRDRVGLPLQNVGLGLTKTTYITSALLLATLVAQFRARRYIPPIYWLGIVLISVVGTQITDNLTDNQGVSLVTTTIVFSIVLAGVFAIWYASERTFSIHSIVTTRREAFYWLTVLFTFALGTAAGDLAAERLALGYSSRPCMFAGVIGLVALAHFRLGPRRRSRPSGSPTSSRGRSGRRSATFSRSHARVAGSGSGPRSRA